MSVVPARPLNFDAVARERRVVLTSTTAADYSFGRAAGAEYPGRWVLASLRRTSTGRQRRSRAPAGGRHLRRDDVGMSVCGSLWVGLVPALPGSRCPYTVVRGSRGAAFTARSGLTSELGPEPGGEPHGGLDLDFANGDAFDIEPKRDTNAPAESDQLDGRVDCLVVGRVEGVIGMA